MEHPIHQQITDILRQNGCWFEEFEHKAVRTSEESASVRPNYSMRQGAKAIIVRLRIPGEGKKFAMLVVPGDQKFDDTKVKRETGAKDIRFATEEEVDKITGGVKPGGVPPFGNLFGLKVISDHSLYDNEKIIFNAGRTSSIGMKSADYSRLVNPKVVEIV
jgi:prolyl-tRNA editing enzyme YbaK/EbsC (Cys-tRNA(Pro) deacylase)